MLRLLSGWKGLSSISLHRPFSPWPLPLAAMYTTRLYSSAGGSGPAGVKPVCRTQLSTGGGGGMTMMENQHHPHPSTQTPSYPLYQGRAEPHRGPRFHGHHPPHHYHPHPHHAPPPPPPPPAQLAPPPHLAPLVLPPHLHHFQQHAHPHHHHHYSAGPSGGRKKSWNFIQEKMSYDTFFTLKRLIERSRRPDEVLRWVTQNPGKISHNHYPVALHKISQLLQGGGRPSATATLSSEGGAASSPPGGGGPGGEESEGRDILEQQDFRTLCDNIIGDCGKFDNFSVVNCLYAVAALGLPSGCRLVEVLEAECQARLPRFNQKDVSMVFSSTMKLHLGCRHPLTEACLAALEKNLERERHPQTLFLLLTYYRLKLRSLQPPEGANGPAASNPEQLLANSVSGVREQEMTLLDEMLAACVREASNKSLELIFSSHLFYQNRQEKFICSLAEELPKKVDSITPYTMALIAKYMARHRLRETQLLDTIADFLVKKAEFLDSKVIQKLVFPFSRMSYRPANQQQLFSKLEAVLELKALSSPLATVNILMSLFQLGHFPSLVLHRVFSPAFISNATNSPYAVIVRRYLSLLDATLQLEQQDYSGPRLHHAHKVVMFDRTLTADQVNRKYSYKGLVAEALRQLVGEQSYKQDEVLAPGYYIDFLLLMDASGRLLPIRPGPADSGVSMTALASDFQKFSPFSPSKGEGPPGGPAEYSCYYPPRDPSLGSQDSSTLSSQPSEDLAPPLPSGAPAPDSSLFRFSIGQILGEESDRRAVPPAQEGFYEGVAYSQSSAQRSDEDHGDPMSIHRVVMSVNDKWHYCHNSVVLVGSRAMRDRHLKLLGYILLQLPYQELEKLNGIEEVKQYLHQKLLSVPL
ncbi:hypothetical protein NHX12_002901 [Muraenolepis orangiensis]|uniref:RAP domain-containing protein n=1 Tax=Muraenolepis orangiensis TaxID=630683 RepID=A0A9Q0DVD9_9TELE|nr:hypothetical protein NHX12_002901 [Muraenolepis orangiensis]